MITIGVDDTDIEDSRGTNAVCRDLVSRLGVDTKGTRIIRHQLLDDPRVPYTSKNGSASIVIDDAPASDVAAVAREARKWLLEWFIEGSDPGLCVTGSVPDDVVVFGHRCKRELIEQREARALAEHHGIHLEGLGGTEGGVIGALAAVGLVTTGDDGRIVHIGGWPWPDEIKDRIVDARVIYDRGIDEIRVGETDEVLTNGAIYIEKHLRPNWRKGRIVLFVERTPSGHAAEWQALRPT